MLHAHAACHHLNVEQFIVGPNGPQLAGNKGTKVIFPPIAACREEEPLLGPNSVSVRFLGAEP